MKLAKNIAAFHYAAIVVVARKTERMWHGALDCFPLLFEFYLGLFLFIYFLVFDCNAVGEFLHNDHTASIWNVFHMTSNFGVFEHPAPIMEKKVIYGIYRCGL